VAVEAVLAIGVLDAVVRGPDFTGSLSPSSLAVAGVIVAAVIAIGLGRRGVRERVERLSPVVVAGAIVAVAAVLLVTGGALEDRYSSRRYGGNPISEFVNTEAPSGVRIGIVGEGRGNYPLFGPELRNEVSYIGPRVEERLVDYDTRREFECAVTRGGYELVMAQDYNLVHPRLPRRQERWLRDLGYRVVAAGLNPGGIRIDARLYAASDSALPTAEVEDGASSVFSGAGARGRGHASAATPESSRRGC
jgi:hypothetical protein